jgi:hypothetical protein
LELDNIADIFRVGTRGSMIVKLDFVLVGVHFRLPGMKTSSVRSITGGMLVDFSFSFAGLKNFEACSVRFAVFFGTGRFLLLCLDLVTPSFGNGAVGCENMSGGVGIGEDESISISDCIFGME